MTSQKTRCDKSQDRSTITSVAILLKHVTRYFKKGNLYIKSTIILGDILFKHATRNLKGTLCIIASLNGHHY